jgi:kynurenine formamidase
MKTIDLSHTISPEMPVYPGTKGPEFSIPCTLGQEGFVEREITMYSHTGTHVDAPAHIIAKAQTLDQMPVDNFVGRASVLDLTFIRKPSINLGDLEPFEAMISDSEFLLLHTGWSQLWGQKTYYKDYPVLNPDAARWLGDFRLKGVGVDMISVDEAESTDFPIHKILLGQKMIIIENLTHLEKLPVSDFIFMCLPLKMENSDGSPVRAVGIIGLADQPCGGE